MAQFEFNQQVDKRAILLLFGCYCNNPYYAKDEKYETVENDYPELFHKYIWGAITNLARKGGIEKITPIDLENEMSQFEQVYAIWNINNGWEYIEQAIEETKDKTQNVAKYRDDVRKYSIVRNAISQLGLDVSFIYNEKDEVVMSRFIKMTSTDVLKEINNKFTDFKHSWRSTYDDACSFHAGDGIKERIEYHKSQENVYGYPFQSGYLTTIFKGMRKKKYIIRSSVSGGGKSRSSMADAINMACDMIYDWNKKEWVNVGKKQPVLFICTELIKDEIQDCLLAHISGIPQDEIEEWKNMTPEREKVLEESSILMEQCTLYVEYTPDYTIDSICEIIESYILNYGITACFFDYINDSPSLYSYYYEKTKTNLRTDQILYMFSEALKSACNRYNIYLGSSTQLNDSYKEDGNKDGSALKGSKAIIEKADGGILALPVSFKDLKKLEPILTSDGCFGNNKPNMSYYIFKNRGGKWKSVIVWTKLDMGTMRETDCFVTNYNYELITDIERTIQDFGDIDVGDVELINGEINIEGSELAGDLSKGR